MINADRFGNFHERKAWRTEYFFKYLYKNKQIKCSACNGSGWYDRTDKRGNSIPCSSCDGTGKEHER